MIRSFVLSVALVACVEYEVSPVVVAPGLPAEPAEPSTAEEPAPRAEPEGDPAEPEVDTGIPVPEEGRVDRVLVPATEPIPMGVYVSAGERISLVASGSWCWGGGMDCSDADGTPGRPIAEELPVLVAGASFGTLVGAIDGGVPFVVGSAAVIEMPATGELFLGMSDRLGYYGDNSGDLQVALSWE